MDLALNDLQRLICHKTEPTSQQTKTGMFKLINLLCVSLLDKKIFQRKLGEKFPRKLLNTYSPISGT